MISIANARQSGRARTVALVGVAAIALLAAVPTVASAASYPRNETLYTGGTQWGNIAGFNTMVGGAHATGTIGLVNETLFRYDPLKDTYIPWLAEKGDWTSDNVYTLTIRKGVKWSDGSPFSAADVKWNLDLGQYDTIPFHNLYTGIKSVEASGDTVTITFSGTPKYQEFQNQIWNIPMSQPAQWKGHDNAKDLATWSPDNPIGTGPYELDKAGYDPTTRVVWKKRDHWWAADAGLAPSPAPKYIIDLVNSSNNVALGLVLTGQEDLNNNYLPGVQQADRRRLRPPDLLSATALHARGQHGLARAQHHQGPDERRGVPQGARGRDQRSADRQRRLRRDGRCGQPDRPAADLGQMGG